MVAFVSGMELSRRLFEEAVRPILADEFPGVVYSAARLGPGSEVLGFDSVRSTDHDWGPRLLLLLDPGDVIEYGADIASVLSHRLPKRIAGWSTHFGEAGADGTAALADTDGPVRHRIEVTDVSRWLVDRLGDDGVLVGELSTVDWLGLPQQCLGEVTAGVVFHDGSGVLERVRRRLAWYPDPVWRYLLACQWMKLSQEEAFVGRASDAGDELGSMVVAARQVREVMRLALLQSRRYVPYSKWLGTAFTRFVPGSDRLGEVLRAVVGERDPDGRPFPVLMADRFAVALRDSIEDPVLRGLPLIGGVDQWIDNTDALTVTRAAAAAVYSA